MIGLCFDKRGEISVDKTSYGIVIAEDVSENGSYQVTDVMAHHFICLKNSSELLQTYKTHIERLLEIYNDPRIKPSIHRHGKPEDPMPALSRMLLIRIKDNTGELVIGDLDNIVFDKKK